MTFLDFNIYSDISCISNADGSQFSCCNTRSLIEKPKRQGTGTLPKPVPICHPHGQINLLERQFSTQPFKYKYSLR